MEREIKMSFSIEVKEEFDLKEAFALWERTSQAGNKYLTGKVDDLKLIGFLNKEKKNEQVSVQLSLDKAEDDDHV